MIKKEEVYKIGCLEHFKRALGQEAENESGIADWI